MEWEQDFEGGIARHQTFQSVLFIERKEVPENPFLGVVIGGEDVVHMQDDARLEGGDDPQIFVAAVVLSFDYMAGVNKQKVSGL
jgi:hypothetical protein